MRYLKRTELKILLLPLLVLPFFWVDKTVALWIKDLRDTDTLFAALNQSAAPFIAIATNGATLMAVALFILFYGKFFSRRLFEAGRSSAIGILAAGAAVQILKHLIGRARPRLTYDPVFIGPSLKSGYDSFPSGHTTAAFCMAFIVSGYFPRYRFLSYFLAVLIGLTRLNGLSHFPSDVVAGAVLGVAAGKVLSVTLFVSKREAVKE